MKLRSKTLRKGFTLIELLVVIAILGALAGVSYGIFSFLNSGDKQAAGENMKQVALALNNFKQNAARYPDDKSAEKYENDAKKKFEHLMPLKDETSNSYFRQLFANPKSSKSIEENQFYAKIPGVTKGDEDTSAGECLKNGENAFAYVLKDDPKAKVRTRTGVNGKNVPLLFCCVKTDMGVVPATELKFDMEAFGDYAMMYTTSGQLTALEADEGLDKEDDTTGVLSSDPFPKDSRTKATTIENYVVAPPAM